MRVDWCLTAAITPGQAQSGSHLLLAVHRFQEQTGKADIQRG